MHNVVLVAPGNRSHQLVYVLSDLNQAEGREATSGISQPSPPVLIALHLHSPAQGPGHAGAPPIPPADSAQHTQTQGTVAEAGCVSTWLLGQRQEGPTHQLLLPPECLFEVHDVLLSESPKHLHLPQGRLPDHLILCTCYVCQW